MTRKIATSIENNFIQGLITEKTALTFPENACIDTDNCIFNSKGNVTRRSGLDIESTTNYLSAKTDTQFYKTYLWEAASGTGNVSLLVVQHGRFLYFFDQSVSTSVMSNKKSFSVDLETRRPTASNLVPSEYQCSFSSGNGDLFVVNAACDPFYVTYNVSTDTISVTTINVEFRDFDGYDDGLGLTVRPVESVATLKINNPKHYYNLINQGWHTTDALTQWDAGSTTLPSNADQVGLYRASETDSFDIARVNSKSPGNSPAPKGHFILSAANPDRVAAAAAGGFSVTIPGSDVALSQSLGTIFTDFTTTTSLAFDGNSNSAFATSATKSTGGLFTGGFIGKSYTNPVSVSRVTISGSNNQGYIASGSTTTVRLDLWGQNGTDSPVILGTTTFNQNATNESTIRTITSTNTTSQFTKLWVNVIKPAISNTALAVAEVTFYTPTGTSVISPQRFTSIAFLGSRVYYSGLNIQGESNKIWFSQIITSKDQYGKCYQKNDPTSEDYFELLSDDGGVIKILEIGAILKLFPLRSSLVVYSSNGVWLIGGSNGIPTATGYTIKKLSGVGTTSPNSIIDVKGMPVWWAEDGIYTMQYDPNYDSFQLVNLTQTTIKSLILNIPQLNRKYVVGAYDSRNEIIIWLYNDSTSLLSSSYSIYNKALCLNTVTKAFYTWTFNTPQFTNIRSIFYTQDASRLTNPRLKFITTVDNTATDEYIYMAEFFDNVWTDWSGLIGGPIDYESHFTTGYKVHGETQKFTQPGYCFVFLNTHDDSSCYLGVRYDYTNSGDSGKWSLLQQVYNPALTLRDVNFRRLKIRGKGRSMQMKFQSESGKPFDIIGWSMRESSNGDI